MSIEYRLYYDEEGSPIQYVCVHDLLEPINIDAQYIEVDHIDYLCKNHSIIVVNGKICNFEEKSVIQKFKHDLSGIKCATEDISIIVDDNYTNTTNWGISA